MTKPSVLLTAALLPAFIVFAQPEKIDTDRPDQTESPVTVGKKWIQLEMGLSKQENKKGATEFQYPTLLTKYGITKAIELRLITTIQANRFYINGNQQEQKESGFSPVAIGAKIALWEEKKSLPKTTLIFHFVIPKLASKKLRADRLAPDFRFSMQNSISNTMALGYNVGAQWDGFSNVVTWIYTFAPGFNISDKWYGYIEAFGFISKQHAPEHSIDGGLAYFVNNNLKLDVSSGFGISKAAADWYIAIGCSIRFKAGK